ncbi:MAG: hypothetical protein FJ399_11165 [Verrucomicrobia bacterium]|nr:hypothetical protein [Verrucomicrobiota bacterium]
MSRVVRQLPLAALLPLAGLLAGEPPPPEDPGTGGSLGPQWAAGTPKMISTVNIRTGEFKVIHRENDWTNRLQCPPTDPQQILFCHEGPWHWVDHTWTIRADGGPARLLHERTMNMEIEGHEFFSQDGGVEPNLHCTRDGRWIIFSGNFHSRLPHGRGLTHAYAVEIAKTR